MAERFLRRHGGPAAELPAVKMMFTLWAHTCWLPLSDTPQRGSAICLRVALSNSPVTGRRDKRWNFLKRGQMFGLTAHSSHAFLRCHFEHVTLGIVVSMTYLIALRIWFRISAPALLCGLSMFSLFFKEHAWSIHSKLSNWVDGSLGREIFLFCSLSSEGQCSQTSQYCAKQACN